MTKDDLIQSAMEMDRAGHSTEWLGDALWRLDNPEEVERQRRECAEFERLVVGEIRARLESEFFDVHVVTNYIRDMFAWKVFISLHCGDGPRKVSVFWLDRQLMGDDWGMIAGTYADQVFNAFLKSCGCE